MSVAISDPAGGATPATSIWREILEDARYAPSPHNIQPWKLDIVSEREATLLYDPTRLIPDEDIDGSYTLAAFGILLEYMAVLAFSKRLRLTYDYNGQILDRHATGLLPLFDVHLSSTDQPPTVDAKLVRQRRTSRLPYNDRPIPEAVLGELDEIAAEYGHRFTFSQDPEVVRWVVGLNADTLFYDMRNDVTRREVDSWIRYTRREAEARRDGLAAFCMHLPGVVLRLFFRHRRLLDSAVVTGLAKWYYLRTMRGTTTVGWITGPFGTANDWLKAGHMLGRIWLKLTEHGLYLHPFGSTITNPIAHDQLLKKFGTSDTPLWLIVRLGYSDVPPRSLRLGVDDLIVS